MKRYLLPLGVFVVMVCLLGAGLRLNPREVPSPLVGKPVPQFRLPTLEQPDTYVSTADLRGKVWILNVWASWCAGCRIEHPVLVDFAKTASVPLYGLNYKDNRAKALGWLRNFGDPYRQSLSDTDGLVGIDFGVYGVPETFVIDREGVIRLKLTGPVTPEALRDTILPLIGKLGA
ncbi:MAG: DsbE family thiol:disulfide interchange protein [Comamonadaceae bacterium]|nr:MAG: DsbE family thiol:disulfide interchange protein [Comamonadaceae bacterium]